jgi:hypothetical protein
VSLVFRQQIFVVLFANFAGECVMSIREKMAEIYELNEVNDSLKFFREKRKRGGTVVEMERWDIRIEELELRAHLLDSEIFSHLEREAELQLPAPVVKPLLKTKPIGPDYDPYNKSYEENCLRLAEIKRLLDFGYLQDSLHKKLELERGVLESILPDVCEEHTEPNCSYHQSSGSLFKVLLKGTLFFSIGCLILGFFQWLFTVFSPDVVWAGLFTVFLGMSAFFVTLRILGGKIKFWVAPSSGETSTGGVDHGVSGQWFIDEDF